MGYATDTPKLRGASALGFEGEGGECDLPREWGPGTQGHFLPITLWALPAKSKCPQWGGDCGAGALGILSNTWVAQVSSLDDSPGRILGREPGKRGDDEQSYSYNTNQQNMKIEVVLFLTTKRNVGLLFLMILQCFSKHFY